MPTTKKAVEAAPTASHTLRKLLAQAKKYNTDSSKILEFGAVPRQSAQSRRLDQGMSPISSIPVSVVYTMRSTAMMR